MDFDDSGIDSASPDFHFATDTKNEPIISFSPGRSRFDTPGSLSTSTSTSSGSNTNTNTNDSTNILSFVNNSSTSTIVNGGIDNNKTITSTPTPTSMPMSMVGPNPNAITTQPSLSTSSSSASAASGQVGVKTTTGGRSLSKPNSGGNIDLQRRLEKRIARANSNSSSPWTTSSSSGTGTGSGMNGHQNGTSEPATMVPLSTTKENLTLTNPNATVNTTTMTSLVNMNATPPQPQVNNPNSNSSSSSTGFGGTKLPSLLPPQRLAIPNKSHSNSSNANDGSTCENKPLVQWESDESEEELSFFPAPRNRGVLNDNLSIDNMSLGDEDDLHLSPPQPLSQRCPCDPRLLLDSHSSSSSSPKSCIIS